MGSSSPYHSFQTISHLVSLSLSCSDQIVLIVGYQLSSPIWKLYTNLNCVKTPFTKDVKSFAQILCHDVVWVGTINKQISHPFPLSSDSPSFLKVFYLRDYTHHKKEPTNNPQCQICFHALKGKKTWDWMGLGWMVIIGHRSSKSTS